MEKKLTIIALACLITGAIKAYNPPTVPNTNIGATTLNKTITSPTSSNPVNSNSTSDQPAPPAWETPTWSATPAPTAPTGATTAQANLTAAPSVFNADTAFFGASAWDSANSTSAGTPTTDIFGFAAFNTPPPPSSGG